MATTTITSPALTRTDIEIATTAAESFARLYYTAYDSSNRLADLPNFYRSDSSLSWNGTPYQGIDGLKRLIERMPPTNHDMHAFDCHPIPGSSPPSLLITVSGNVIHGLGPSGNPPSTPAKAVDGQPRVFSQTFMLVPDPAAPQKKAGEMTKYYVGADVLRFVG